MHKCTVYPAAAVLFLFVFCWTGCVQHKQSTKPPAGVNSEKPGKGQTAKRRVVAATDKTGKVAKVNTNARFVVLNFPVGSLPERGASYALFRNGLQVGEARISGPQLDDNVVADLIAGEAEVGDEARVP